MPDTTVNTAGITATAWRAHLTSDPRAADYPDDARLWVRLLTAAYDRDGDHPEGIFAALSGIRAMGARLELTTAGTRIVPGELGSDYAEIKRVWLMPHADTLREMLRAL